MRIQQMMDLRNMKKEKKKNMMTEMMHLIPKTYLAEIEATQEAQNLKVRAKLRRLVDESERARYTDADRESWKDNHVS